jgi:hypothetical protein
MNQKCMNIVYLIIFYFILTIPSYGSDIFYVYIKNITPHTLNFKTSLGGSVLPHQQAIFEAFSCTYVSPFIHKLTVKGEISVKNNPSQKCHVNFKTYTQLDAEMTDKEGTYRMINFATFILVTEKNGHLMCTPVAAEVYPASNEMLANGKIVPLESAKKKHKKLKNRPLVGQCHIYTPGIENSEINSFKNEKLH